MTDVGYERFHDPWVQRPAPGAHMVTADALNHMEDGILRAHSGIPGSAENPHVTQGAARNESLTVNYWRYPADSVTSPTNHPTYAVMGDVWQMV